MRSDCAEFRVELERLAGEGNGPVRLAGHAHIRACVPCRALLEEERRLDGLLAELEGISIPPGLSERVLEAVADARRSGPTNASTAGSTLREGDLEELLERVPVPHVPSGLAGQVLRGLAPVRAPRRSHGRRRRWLVAAAATVLGGLALWGWKQGRLAGPREESGAGSPLAVGATETDAMEGDEDLLAYAVERWEILNEDDLDLWLASLDPVDEFLMEHSDGGLFDADDDESAGSSPREE